MNIQNAQQILLDLKSLVSKVENLIKIESVLKDSINPFRVDSIRYYVWNAITLYENEKRVLPNQYWEITQFLPESIDNYTFRYTIPGTFSQLMRHRRGEYVKGMPKKN